MRKREKEADGIPQANGKEPQRHEGTKKKTEPASCRWFHSTAVWENVSVTQEE